MTFNRKAQNFNYNYILNDSDDNQMEEIPETFLCPISYSIMNDPVIMPDGHTYEREAIRSALRKNPISPFTRQPMDMNQAVPNYALKNLIESYKNQKKSSNRKTNEPTNRDIQQLISMGFDKQSSIEALKQAKNCVNEAIQILSEKYNQNNYNNESSNYNRNNYYNNEDDYYEPRQEDSYHFQKKSVNKTKNLQQLISMGFDKQSSIEALKQANNNVNDAIQILIEQDQRASYNNQKKSVKEQKKIVRTNIQDNRNLKYIDNLQRKMRKNNIYNNNYKNDFDDESYDYEYSDDYIPLHREKKHKNRKAERKELSSKQVKLFIMYIVVTILVIYIFFLLLNDKP